MLNVLYFFDVLSLLLIDLSFLVLEIQLLVLLKLVDFSSELVLGR